MGYEVTTIDLLRHGKPEGGEIFRGKTDVVLLEEGWQQMQDKLTAFSGWTRVVSSPMKRCHDFGKAFSSCHNISFEQDERIREISFGDWDGVSYEEVKRECSEGFKAFWRDPIGYTPPNAEPMIDFSQRITGAFSDIVEKHKSEHILMITHGGVVRAVMADVLKAESVSMTRFEVPYACLTRIKIYHDQDASWPQLVFHNP